MKKVLCGIVALVVMCATCVLAFAEGIQPRYSNINELSYSARQVGDEVVVSATLSTRKSMSLKINVTVKEDGTTIDTFSASDNNDELWLDESTLCESGHVYKVTFTFNAGGEVETTTKTVRT